MYPCWLKIVVSSLLLPLVIFGAEQLYATQQLELTSPKRYQVMQRIGVSPGKGFADVTIAGALPTALVANAVFEFRIVLLADPPDSSVKPESMSPWAEAIPIIDNDLFGATVTIPAGGWYRLECRWRSGDDVVANGAVEPIGVGEVFLVAGQSYATNCNDERLSVTDRSQRIVAFDTAKQTWSVAHDPQPVFDSSDGGSIWPPLGDALAQELKVPIGFANVAIGGSSSSQWLPTGEMHQRLIQAANLLGNFRAVLWQQGESDVIAKNSTEGYVANISAIHEAFTKALDSVNQRNSPPWLLAKSTHHPTVYHEPEGEQRIRSGVDALIKKNPAFIPGPDTDELKDANRGDINSRRHFSGMGQRRAAEMWFDSIRQQLFAELGDRNQLTVGLGETDITPPVGFPMAGYYHERLAEGQIDPLKAKAIVFRQAETTGALVICDLIGIATDLSREIKRRASQKTGIPSQNIVIAATHSHTAPDYVKALWLYLGQESQEELRSKYIEKLISGPVEAIEIAVADLQACSLTAGSVLQTTPVSFNRRFVMRDGSVQTWQSLSNPAVVRAAGPVDPHLGLLTVRQTADGKLRGLLSNFALHLDTVGGMRWSADYPYFIERTIRKHFGAGVISIFGTGCCGDINHVDPSTTRRNKVDVIGNALGSTICEQFPKLQPLMSTRLNVQSQVVQLPLQLVTAQEVEKAIELVSLIKQGGKVEFLDHVLSYKHLVLDQFQKSQPVAEASKHITWGLSRALSGIGSHLPVEVTTITIGDEVAIVCLPGEVFVELGLAIKQASPFKTTIIVELSNAKETIYVPHRAAYAGGSYEVTNSTLQPGSGEMLVEAAIKLLRQSIAK